MTVLVITNQKGGVGKTTTAISLGAALVGTGQRVLIVDLDPQANATSGLGVGKEPPNPIYGVLLKEQPLTDSIASTALDRLEVLGIVLTMEDRRNRLSLQVIDEVRRHFPTLVTRARIPRTVRLAEAPSHGIPISLYEPHSPASQAYDDLARELLARLHKTEPLVVGGAIA